MTQRKTQAGRTFLKKKKLDIPSSLVDELRLSQDRALRTTDGVKFTDVKHTYNLYSLHYRLKTNWNIAIYMCALTAAMIRLHLI